MTTAALDRSGLAAAVPAGERLHALDALRGFALLLGVVLHAAMSYLPGFDVWPLLDRSTSVPLGITFFVIHIFRMTTFFVLAGFFARLLIERRGVRGFVRNRSLRIVVPLVVGWIVFFPMIAAAMWWGMGGQMPQAPQGTDVPEAPLLPFPLAHLWFLYVLTLIYMAALPARRLVHAVDGRGHLRAGLDTLFHGVAAGPWAPFVLAVPVMLALSVSDWIPWGGIPTPDRTLIPNLPATVAFSTAFLAGWLLHRQPGLLRTFERQWPLHAATAVGLTVVCLWMIGLTPSGEQTWTARETTGYTVLYASASWSWTLALVGGALRFFSGQSSTRRYVSDASYWIYLAHLPVVVALQAAMRDLPWHWSVKFPLLMAIALVFLFATYHWLVRFTFVGEVLNGVKHRRPGRHDETAAGLAHVASVGDTAPLAQLANVHKRFGTVTALDGLSLDVRPGELLAVLGPNGAGKSTAISLLLGLQQADSGAATLFGRAPEDIEARYGVGVMMQEVTLPIEMTVRQIIALTVAYYPAPLTVDETMTLTHTTDFADRAYGKLSAGQKRQVQFAVAVCGRPSLLFLDEPTVGLDVQARETLWATIRLLLEQGASIVLTTHYLEEAEALANRVAVLAKGRLVAIGSVDEIRGVVSRKRISCLSALSADDVASWTNVSAATHSGGRLQIVARDADDVVRRLLAADATLRDLEIQRAGLAEAFNEITQEAA